MKLPQNRKLRIIINGIILNTTKGKIGDLFGNAHQLQSVIDTLQYLEANLATKVGCGISQNSNGYQVQIDLV